MNIIEKLKPIEADAKIRWIPVIGSEKAKVVLDILSKYKPKRILELGCAIGYSTMILGSLGASVVSVDTNNKELIEARENFSKFGFSNIETINGHGNEVMKGMVDSGEKFDLIFLDFEKRYYVEALELCYNLLEVGGVLLTDNINHPKSALFKEMMLKDSRFESSLEDVGDGILVSVKVI
jgi:predicted O-methyltransferase YrrM